MESISIMNNEKIFQRIFSINGRVRRLEYNIFLFSQSFIGGIIQHLPDNTSDVVIIFMFIILLFFTILSFIAGIKRCHDRNHSGWWFLIPLYYGYLIFAKSKEGINKYGSDPTKPYKEQVS